MSRRLTPIGLLVALLAFNSVANAQKRKVAVLGLETRGAQSQHLVGVAKIMSGLLRKQVIRRDSPYDLSSVEEDFLTIKIMHDCTSANYSCMARITKDVLKASLSIYGTVEKDNNGYVFQLTLLNAETAQPEGQLTEVVPLAEAENPDKAGTWAKAFYSQLTGRRQEGRLVVRSNVSAGVVFVDDKKAGNLADGVVVVPNVKPGSHEVRVEADGQTAKTTVKVMAGETSEVELSVVTGPTGPTGPNGDGGSGLGWKVAFYGGAVATVAAGIGWGYYGTGVVFTDRYKKRVDAANDGLTNPITTASDSDDICDSSQVKGTDAQFDPVRKACDKGNQAATLATAFGIGTGVAAAFTFFFAYKAFLDGGDSAERDDLSSNGRKRKEPRVRILPGGPGDIGAGLEVTF